VFELMRSLKTPSFLSRNSLHRSNNKPVSPLQGLAQIFKVPRAYAPGLRCFAPSPSSPEAWRRATLETKELEFSNKILYEYGFVPSFFAMLLLVLTI
jgi:hypothetical protein